MSVLSKEEFTSELVGQAEALYQAYVAKASASNLTGGDALLSVKDELPSFTPSDQVVSDADADKAIADLKAAMNAEKIAFEIGKVAFSIAVTMAKSGV